jgi:hypothetical protein
VKDEKEIILLKDERTEKGLSYLSMRGWLNLLVMRFRISSANLVLQQGTDKFCAATYSIFRKNIPGMCFYSALTNKQSLGNFPIRFAGKD